MNIKTELAALAVRFLAEKGAIQKPDAFSEFLNTMFGGESYDKRYAHEIVSDLEKAAAAISRIRTNKKFKKIITHSM